jgi:prepilin-type N-terminal cleavage/methylation domain-containing protein
MHRVFAAFTLVELLVAIVVIAILSGLVLGALQRAAGQSKVLHTKSTISKLHASMMDHWDTYRTRRVPIDPNNIAQGMNAGMFTYAAGQIATMSSRRIANSGGQLNAYPVKPYDSLSVPPGIPGIFPTGAQIAAMRLLALREIQQYEMPQSFGDFADMSGSPGSYQLRSPTILGNYVAATKTVQPLVPGLAYTYLAALNAATTTNKSAIEANQSAECLYMILTIGSSDSSLIGEQPIPLSDVGDVDGDGLPEFQDAWPVAQSSFSTISRANSPINWIRWPAGFFPSDFLADPNSPSAFQFSMAFHDPLDPLKLDVPFATAQTPAAPRGYRLTPLIFSAGPDGEWGLIQNSSSADPYDNSSPGMSGALASGMVPGVVLDNITNQDVADKR